MTRSQTTSRRKRTVVDEAKKFEVKNNVMDVVQNIMRRADPLRVRRADLQLVKRGWPTAGKELFSDPGQGPGHSDLQQTVSLSSVVDTLKHCSTQLEELP